MSIEPEPLGVRVAQLEIALAGLRSEIEERRTQTAAIEALLERTIMPALVEQLGRERVAELCREAKTSLHADPNQSHADLEIQTEYLALWCWAAFH